MDNQLFRTYNCLDAACTFQIRNEFWPDFKKADQAWAYAATIRLYEPLMAMQARGIRVDFDALNETRREVNDAIATAQAELDRLCGRPLNVNSPKDCQKYFYLERGIKPYLSPKTHTVTTDDLAMQRIARGISGRPGLREASLVQEVRGLGKLLSTYLNIQFDSDWRFRCSYNPRGTRFGRLSSSKTIYNTGMNAQNLPQEFKKFLVADEGYFFLELDKRQAEWVVVAYLSMDANMLAAIENGVDVHTHTATLMYNVPPAAVKYEAKALSTTSDSAVIAETRLLLAERYPELRAPGLPRSMSLRQAAKKANHGLNYDERAQMFSLINEIEIPEAERIIALYHSIYPNIRQVWYERIKESLTRDRMVENCFGRKYRFLDAWGPDLLKAAYAFQPQSTVVDSLNLGMCEIYEDRGPLLGPTELLAQVHDSVLLQVPVELAPSLPDLFEACDQKLSPTLCYNGREFRIATDAKVGFNWGTRSDSNPNGMREYVPGDFSWLER